MYTTKTTTRDKLRHFTLVQMRMVMMITLGRRLTHTHTIFDGGGFSLLLDSLRVYCFSH